MNHKKVQAILEKARRRFLKHEAYLLSADANERSLTHKFAEHLQAAVGGDWSVDCEYNRYGQDAKKIIEEVQQVVGTTVATDETKAKTVYPDIIIHKRGAKGPNLLVIEAKKDASRSERDNDWPKLESIKDQYKYEFATFVNFVTSKKQIKFELV